MGVRFNFATCDRQRAFHFLHIVTGEPVKDEPGAAKELLDLIEKDIVRLQDPSMYGNRIAVLAGTLWDSSHREAVVKACKQITISDEDHIYDPEAESNEICYWCSAPLKIKQYMFCSDACHNSAAADLNQGIR